MTTKTIWADLILITFCACIHPARHPEYRQQDTIDPVNAGISLVEGRYRIDTAVILANKNLPALIDQLEATKLTEKTRVSDIPEEVQYFLKHATDDHFSIANPGDDWQAGCIVDKRLRLPSRQLAYLGTGPGIILLTYYTGGFGVMKHVLLFHFNDTTLLDFWCGAIPPDMNSRTEIIQYLKQHINEQWSLNSNILFL